ncbi:uncharacterized protein [Panulirus ornatus]|uniref:uncharacterized protein n=1 Tax=Panulirus ornatus TaxID=150431 RepID=UPI003A8944DB
MASFLQYALSPFPRRRSRQGDRSSTSSRNRASSTPPSPAPTPSPTPRTRSVGIQTPVLQRRGLGFGFAEAPPTPGTLRRLKEKTREAWQGLTPAEPPLLAGHPEGGQPHPSSIQEDRLASASA